MSKIHLNDGWWTEEEALAFVQREQNCSREEALAILAEFIEERPQSVRRGSKPS